MRLSNIDTQLMRSFITINDAGGFARAAEILHMTQPAISQQMRRLEELVGQPLFERHGRLMLLNMHGETLLGYARQIVALNDEAIRRLSDVKRERETVILGMPEHFSDTALHLIIAEAAHQLPNIRLVVKSGTTQRLIDGLEQGKIDLALTLSEAGSGQGQVLQKIPVAWISGDSYQLRS
jgi:DNA-binding transcriptional LysR family regulator